MYSMILTRDFGGEDVDVVGLAPVDVGAVRARTVVLSPAPPPNYLKKMSNPNMIVLFL